MQNLCFIFNIYNRSPEQPPHTTHLDGLDRLLIEHKISIYSLDQFNFFLSCHLYEFLFVVCQKFDFFCIRSTPPPTNNCQTVHINVRGCIGETCSPFPIATLTIFHLICGTDHTHKKQPFFFGISFFSHFYFFSFVKKMKISVIIKSYRKKKIV